MAHGVGALFHLIPEFDKALLAPTLAPGLRKHISTLDAYATAQYAGYSGYTTYPVMAPVPLPSSLALCAAP